VKKPMFSFGKKRQEKKAADETSGAITEGSPSPHP
jgi:hypothetical protein